MGGMGKEKWTDFAPSLPLPPLGRVKIKSGWSVQPGNSKSDQEILMFHARMLAVSALVLVVLFLGLAAPLASAAPGIIDGLEGTWKVVSITIDGKMAPNAE